MGIFPPCSSSEMFENLLGTVCGKIRDAPKIEEMKIKGTVVLMKKNVMEMTDVGASFLDRVHEIFGKGVSLQLISASHADPANGSRGKLGKEAYLENWVSKFTSLSAKDDATFNITFDWDESMGVPGAFIIRNHHHSQFYLKKFTLEDIPGQGQIQFVCNSWVYPTHRYKYDRVFFAYETYLPCNTPEPLRAYREDELINLRGDGSGMLKEWDRVYDYAFYNDLGSPEKGPEYARPVLGGSKEFPYPRRGRTGRRPNKKDSNLESRLPLLNLNIYVPRDERFSHVKFSDFLSYSLKSLGQVLVPEIGAVFDETINEFDKFQDIHDLYEGGIKLPESDTLKNTREFIPWESFKKLLHSDGDRLLQFPTPDIIKSMIWGPLRAYREDELINLRGDGSGMLKEWDRVYDYAFYNDLGSPEKGPEYARPVLGGSKEFPYPRRGRTGRRPNKKDSNLESRLPLLNLNIYVPRDERFSHVKFSDFLSYSLKSLGQVLVPEIGAVFDETINEFDKFQDIHDLYEGGIKLPESDTLKNTREFIPWESFKKLLHSDGDRLLQFPTPDIIKNDRTAWRTDEEFGREMLAGVNPVIIRRLKEFPPASKLDPKVYGNQNSSMTREHIEKNMNGLTVEEAIADNRLFILDYHDVLTPYLRRINTTTTKTYASRTVLLLQDNGTLMPLAIELSREQPDENVHDPICEVFTTSEHGIENSKWQLAKAYAAVNDSGYHQLISHWLNTHAVIEPFVIATNRQLSVLHPIYKLLQPHFRDTMNINALARHTLVNAGGILERTVFPARYAMEMSSVLYKNWNFTEQALPEDLLKRGVAVKDPSHRHGLRLLIEDYPYAVDGLEIWSAIKDWVSDYCSIYYNTDDMIQSDSELQSWWMELREEGHGDLKDEPWWPKMQTNDELVQTCTIIIWVASALHAAVNFGQYPYAGYLPNRPTVSRRFMPEPDTPEHAELESNPDLSFLKTITAQFQTLLGVSLIEILSQHSTEEIYLGQRDTSEWPSDKEKEAFTRFSNKLVKIENEIIERNNDQGLRNRVGPVNVPYTLLYPNTSDYSKKGGLTGRGIPNSISI